MRFISLIFVFLCGLSAHAEDWVTFNCGLMDDAGEKVVESNILQFAIGAYEDGNPLNSFVLRGESLKDSMVQYYFRINNDNTITSNFVVLRHAKSQENGKVVEGRIRYQGSLSIDKQNPSVAMFKIQYANMDAEIPSSTVGTELYQCDYELL